MPLPTYDQLMLPLMKLLSELNEPIKISDAANILAERSNLHEEDLMGNSAIYKSAACNLMFSRNKEATDDVERNTTVMKATKIRWTGKTGIAGQYYYDNETHTMWDLDDWLIQN